MYKPKSNTAEALQNKKQKRFAQITKAAKLLVKDNKDFYEYQCELMNGSTKWINPSTGQICIVDKQ